MFWGISAQHEGDIKKTQPKIDHQAPYLDIKLDTMRHETAKLWDYFYAYIQTVVQGPNTIEGLVEDFSTLVEQAPGKQKAALI